MFWKLKKIKKKSFLLVEVLVSLALVGSFMPAILRDQCLYKREVERLFFLNAFENAFKQLLFHLYYDVHGEDNMRHIVGLGSSSITISYKPLKVPGYGEYPTLLTLQRHDRGGDNYQISAIIKVLNLPYNTENLQKDPQHFWIKKNL